MYLGISLATSKVQMQSQLVGCAFIPPTSYINIKTFRWALAKKNHVNNIFYGRELNINSVNNNTIDRGKSRNCLIKDNTQTYNHNIGVRVYSCKLVGSYVI